MVENSEARNSPQEGATWIHSLIEHWGVSTQFEQFQNLLNAQEYTQQEQDYIFRAFAIGIAAHQENEDIKSRMRKSGGAYFTHPLEMAIRGAQSRLDWLTLAATLLHDVPEDVQIENLNSQDRWLEFIQQQFQDAGQEQAETLVSVIKGVTKREMFPEGEERALLVEAMDEIPFVKTAMNFALSFHNPDDPTNGGLSDEEKEEVYKVSYDLFNTFATGLQSPEHWRVFAVKMLDTWHNWDTPEVIEAGLRKTPESRAKVLTKMLRARVAAGLADWMGWDDMCDDLVQRITLNFSSPHQPKLRDTQDEQVVSQQASHNDIVAGMLSAEYGKKNKKLKRSDIAYIHNRMLFLSTDTARKTRHDTLPRPQVKCVLRRNALEESVFCDDRISSIRTNIDREGKYTIAVFSRYDEQKATIRNLLGRVAMPLTVRFSNGPSTFMTLESDEPHIIDYLLRENSQQPQVVKEQLVDEIPEAALFHRNVAKASPYGSDDGFSERHGLNFGALASFMYDPQNLVLRGNDVRIMLVEDRNKRVVAPNRLPYHPQKIYIVGEPNTEQVSIHDLLSLVGCESPEVNFSTVETRGREVAMSDWYGSSIIDIERHLTRNMAGKKIKGRIVLVA